MSEKPKDPFLLWSSILKRTGMLLRQHKDNPRFAQDLSELAGVIHWAMQQDQEIGTFEMMHGETMGYAIAHSLQTAFVAGLAAGRAMGLGTCGSCSGPLMPQPPSTIRPQAAAAVAMVRMISTQKREC